MKRWPLKLVLLLPLISGGAIINVAVAWTICLLNSWDGTNPQRCGNVSTASGECLTFVLTSHRGAEIVDWFAGKDVPRTGGSGETVWPPRWCWVPAEPGFQAMDVPGHMPNSEWTESAAGWPLLSMRWCLEVTQPAPMNRFGPTGKAQFKARRLAIRLPDRVISNGRPSSRLCVLPMDPVLAGFAVNTAFYAALLWLVLLLPRGIRRRLRVNRGLCPACAYPVGTSDKCTECGKSVVLSRDRQGAPA